MKSSITLEVDRSVGIWKFMGGNVAVGVVELEERNIERRIYKGGEYSMKYIKWLPKGDLAIGFYMGRMNEIFEKYDSDKQSDNINETIELFVANRYMQEKRYPIVWTQKEIDKNLKKVKTFNSRIGKELSNITNENFIQIYNEVARECKSSFWDIFEKYKLYNRIEFTNIIEAFGEKAHEIVELLKHKDIVNHYGKKLRYLLLSNNLTAEWLLQEYEIKNDNRRDKFFFPPEFNQNDRAQVIEKYIEDDDANLNYLRVIANIQDNRDTIYIGNKIKLKARKKVEKKEAELFGEGTGITTEITVIFKKNFDEIVHFSYDNGKLELVYDINWIDNNTDYPTLLNNFIFLFGYIDSQARIAFINRESAKGVFERFLFTQSKKSYNPGYATQMQDVLGNLQMQGYYKQLQKLEISLEEIMKWYFEIYLFEEFGLKNYRMNIPSKNTTYLEKCRMMLSEMDGVLKQYNLYVDDKEINQELLQISSEHMKFRNMKSLLNNKYVYGIGQDYEMIKYYLFSDQCMLSYIERIGEKYTTFFDLLSNEEVYETDYSDVGMGDIIWLKEHNIISVDSGKITFVNIKRILVLKDLYENEFINFYRRTDIIKAEIMEMKKEGLVEFDTALFARPEQDYFDYYLNMSSFNNGYDLRNKYIHASQPNSSKDEIRHQNNYMIILKLFMLIILKINDDIECNQGNNVNDA